MEKHEQREFERLKGYSSETLTHWLIQAHGTNRRLNRRVQTQAHEFAKHARTLLDHQITMELDLRYAREWREKLGLNRWEMHMSQYERETWMHLLKENEAMRSQLVEAGIEPATTPWASAAPETEEEKR